MKKTGKGKSRVKQRLIGGPYSGQVVYMNSTGTLPFRVQGWYGRYDERNSWVHM